MPPQPPGTPATDCDEDRPRAALRQPVVWWIMEARREREDPMRRAELRALTTREAYPSVSILMPTHRAQPEMQQDPLRLKNLIEDARRRLADEVGKRPSWPLLDRLEAMREEVDWRFNQDGLALFASDDFTGWYRLPFPVEARVAVDRTFDTRDIVYALHRMPRYRVLALAERPTRLFEGTGVDLEEVRDGAPFPVVRKGPRGLTHGPDAPQMRKSRVRVTHQDAFFTEVDQALVAATEHDRLPLVVIGTERSLANFERVSANLADVAVRIAGSHDDASVATIAGLAWPRLQEWLHAQRQAAIEQVGEALGARRLASGIDDAWNAARGGQGARLVVEEEYRQPAILHRDTGHLELIHDREAMPQPLHLDDAIDELIEMVLDKGGEVVFVDEGALAEHARVALMLRY
jgi:hypothetical protein